jgi:hypothetical protein
MSAPIRTCDRRSMDEGLKTSAQKSTISARTCGMPSMTSGLPSSSSIARMVEPAGVCCQELAITIQTAENIEPRKTIIVEKKWTFRETRSHPKTSTARKPDSRKKAKMPSAANAEPKTSPTNRE